MSKYRGIPIASLGQRSLDQLQAQGFDVAKLLSKSAPGRKHKYGVSDLSERQAMGINFSSKLEKSAYLALTATHIPFEFQVVFVLQDPITVDGKNIRQIYYVADFVLISSTGLNAGDSENTNMLDIRRAQVVDASAPRAFQNRSPERLTEAPRPLLPACPAVGLSTTINSNTKINMSTEIRAALKDGVFNSQMLTKRNEKMFVIDMKGVETAVFKLKSKMFAARYGFAIDRVRSVSALLKLLE